MAATKTTATASALNPVPEWLIAPAKASASAVTNTAKSVDQSSKLVLTSIVKVRSMIKLSEEEVQEVTRQDMVLAGL